MGLLQILQVNSWLDALDQGTGLVSGVGARVLYVGCPLLPWNGLNAENQFHNIGHCANVCD